jgi:hypothetical protein
MKTTRTVIFVVIFCFFATKTVFSQQNITEINDLIKKFAEQVNSISLEKDYEKIVLEKLDSQKIETAQYLLFVDRNPEKQIAIVFFVDPKNKQVILIGADKISTGDPNRKGHFVTPVGLFENLPKCSFRAKGTKNKKGIQGFGIKNSRVWDFGWIETQTKKGEPFKIRFMIHSTDPIYGEPKLGRIASKGCVRVSAKMNRFLDYFGILDAGYENNKRSMAMLLKKRETVSSPGKFIFISDSSDEE